LWFAWNRLRGVKQGLKSTLSMSNSSYSRFWLCFWGCGINFIGVGINFGCVPKGVESILLMVKAILGDSKRLESVMVLLKSVPYVSYCRLESILIHMLIIESILSSSYHCCDLFLVSLSFQFDYSTILS